MKSVGPLALVVGQRYRARLLIKAPKLVAGESRVRTELEGEGFRQIAFFDKTALPADWLSAERDDPSGFGSWTAYLEGVFTGEEAPGASSIDANKNVQLLGFWPYGQTPAVPGQPPGPVGPPPPMPPSPPTPAMEWQERAGGVAALCVSMVAAYWLQSRWLRRIR